MTPPKNSPPTETSPKGGPKPQDSAALAAADKPPPGESVGSGNDDPADSVSIPVHGTPERIVQLYGDLLFDLCESVLWSPINAQLAFRSIIKSIRRNRRGHGFTEHERAWVLRIACDKLLDLSARHGRKLTSSEQIQLDSAQNVTLRLKQFDAYFHRLVTEDQILLLLRDKYGLPYGEISAALGLPEANLKIRRAQALRSLEEWLWDEQRN